MVISLNCYKYQKNAVAVGQLIRFDEYNNYIHTNNKSNFRKEYVKAYMKLLSK